MSTISVKIEFTWSNTHLVIALKDNLPKAEQFCNA